ncbi:hypothetical protein C2G38_2137426 [Gigaspora rosea]|uniref:Uncharacterized protein n=1 Tax=Gigaspora rosea TaxID=44941 RepID=A0A397W0E8_9GLOM|nr:hypothetical protein C2G38_2137426 [Gigaspora rosea]CAG8592431.1 9197_t:CDS:1 [Gigaspora rosea]
MLKTRIIATFIVLFAFIFNNLHATPLPRAVGDKIIATLKKLNGTVVYAQVGDFNCTLHGEFNEGFDENAPDRYFLEYVGLNPRNSFKTLDIPIHPPKAGPYESSGFFGCIEGFTGANITIYKDDTVLDSAIFVKE